MKKMDLCKEPKKEGYLCVLQGAPSFLGGTANLVDQVCKETSVLWEIFFKKYIEIMYEPCYIYLAASRAPE